MVSKYVNWWWRLGLLAVLGGCGNADIEGPIATSEEALGASCADAEPLVRYALPFEFVSPRTYSPPDCFKGQVIQWDGPFGPGYNGEYGTPPPFTGDNLASPMDLEVSWADTLIGTQAECEASVVRGYLFHLSETSIETVEIRSKTGEWKPYGCVMPSFLFTSVSRYDSYRIAVNARTGPSSAAATRKVRVKDRTDL